MTGLVWVAVTAETAWGATMLYVFDATSAALSVLVSTPTVSSLLAMAGLPTPWIDSVTNASDAIA